MSSERARDLMIGGREATEWIATGWVEKSTAEVIEWGDRDSNGFDWAARLRLERGRMVFDSEDVPCSVMRALAERLLVRLPEHGSDPTGSEILAACGYRSSDAGWVYRRGGVGDGEW